MSEDVKPYSEEEAKKTQITSMFDRIAPNYDFLNHFLSLGIDFIWRRKAIKTLVAEKPKQILDIATGTGDLAFEAAKKLKPERIVALDISSKMLEQGKTKSKKKGLEAVVEFVLGDSENLSYKNNTFDACTVAFGVRNFGDIKKGLNEMRRVLKDDGKLVVLEFSKPRYFPVKQLFNFYFRFIAPFLGRLISSDSKAYTYLYESVQAFPDYENFVAVLKELGYKEANYRSLSFGICCIYTAKK